MVIFGVKAQNIEINKLELNNPIFMEVLENYIQKNAKANSKFKNEGYISFSILQSNLDAVNNDTLISCSIKYQYYSLIENETPLYFFYVDETLVLVYDPVISSNFDLRLSSRSKSKINHILKPYLPEKEHVIAKDKDGKIIINDPNFRDEAYNLHGGIRLYILANGDYKILQGS